MVGRASGGTSKSGIASGCYVVGLGGVWKREKVKGTRWVKSRRARR